LPLDTVKVCPNDRGGTVPYTSEHLRRGKGVWLWWEEEEVGEEEEERKAEEGKGTEGVETGNSRFTRNKSQILVAEKRR
jgi:hypothetical protein